MAQSVQTGNEIKKKKRKLRFLMQEWDEEFAILTKRFQSAQARNAAFIDSKDDMVFLKKYHSAFSFLEEGLDKFADWSEYFPELNDCGVEDMISSFADKSAGYCNGGDFKRGPGSETETSFLDTEASPVVNGICNEEPERAVSVLNNVCVEESGGKNCSEVTGMVVPQTAEEEEGGLLGMVTCFTDPSDFYFLTLEQVRIRDMFNMAMSTVLTGDGVPVRKIPKTGQLYAKRCEKTNFWSRVQVVGAVGTMTALVQEIDSGNSTLIPNEKLVSLPDGWPKYPPLAHRCSLHGVVPLGEEWSADCVRTAKFLLRTEPVAKVGYHNTVDGVAQVDLIVTLTRSTGNLDISVAEFLVESGRARYGEVDKEPVGHHTFPMNQVAIACVPRPTTSESLKSTSSEWGSSLEAPKKSLAEKVPDFTGGPEVSVDCAWSEPVEKSAAKSTEDKLDGEIKSKMNGAVHEIGGIVSGNLDLMVTFEQENYATTLDTGSSDTEAPDDDPPRPEPGPAVLGNAASEMAEESSSSGSGRFFFGKPDVTIPPLEVQIEMYSVCHVAIALIKDPGNFYVYVEADETIDALVAIDEVLESVAANGKSPDKGTVVSVGTYCCAELTSGEWCRCEIMDVDLDGPNGAYVMVRALDIGEEEWISLSNIRPMPREIAKYPAFAVKCCLGGVTPAGPFVDEWTEEAVAKLMEFCPTEKILKANLFSKSDDGTISLLLWDITDTCELIINEELVKLGLANSTIFNLATSSNGDCVDSNQNWDPMADDYVNERNKCSLGFDDAEMALTNYKRQDEKLICHLYQRGLVCKRGNSCKFKHVTPSPRFTTDTQEAIVDNSTVTVESKVVVAFVTACVNPERFYVNIIDDRTPVACGDDYATLFKSLQLYCNKEEDPQSCVTIRAEGEIVAAFGCDGYWYRARVISTNTAFQRVKVFDVDVGSSSWVKEEDTRDLPLEFLHCPFQAILCTMDIAPANSNPGDCHNWTKSSIQHFVNLITNRILYLRIFDEYSGGRLSVDMYKVDGSEMSMVDRLVESGFAKKRQQ